MILCCRKREISTKTCFSLTDWKYVAKQCWNLKYKIRWHFIYLYKSNKAENHFLFVSKVGDVLVDDAGSREGIAFEGVFVGNVGIQNENTWKEFKSLLMAIIIKEILCLFSGNSLCNRDNYNTNKENRKSKYLRS